MHMDGEQKITKYIITWDNTSFPIDVSAERFTAITKKSPKPLGLRRTESDRKCTRATAREA